MFRARALFGVVLMAAPAWAAINPEDFGDPGYVVGNKLGAFYFADVAGNSAGVMDIDGTNDPGERYVKLSANGPDPGPAFPTVTSEASAWGGPTRSNGTTAPGLLTWSVDIHKGYGVDTPLTNNIWTMGFRRQNNNEIFTLQGGLGTVLVKSSNATPQFNSGAFNLADGWNRICVVNDSDAATNGGSNVRLFLNGVQVYNTNVTGGTLTSNTTSVFYANLSRSGRGGTGDHFVGTMWFDNIISANETLDCAQPQRAALPDPYIPEPATLSLLALGSLALVRRSGRMA